MFKLRRNTVKENGISKRKGVKSGFTLVELLVVIAIIALLMSILMPALRRVKMQAEEVKCKANLRQVGLIMFMFFQDEDFKMPDVWTAQDAPNHHLWTPDGLESTPRYDPWGTTNTYDAYWGTWFNSYVKDIDIFGCPAMTQFAEMLATDLIYSYNLAPGVDPKDIVKTAAFGLNAYLDGLNTNSVKTHSQIIICTDHVEPRNEQAHQAAHGDTFCMGVDTVNLSHYRRPPSGHAFRPDHYRGIFRHNIRKGGDYNTGGRAAVLWLDGRASAIDETTGEVDPRYPSGEAVPNRWYDPRGNDLDISRPTPPPTR